MYLQRSRCCIANVYFSRLQQYFFKTSVSLLQYCRAEPSHNIVDSKSFKFKSKFTDDGVALDVEITVPLKYLSDFWIAFEMTMTIFEINFLLALSANFVICKAYGAIYLEITDAKL